MFLSCECFWGVAQGVDEDLLYDILDVAQTRSWDASEIARHIQLVVRDVEPSRHNNDVAFAMSVLAPMYQRFPDDYTVKRAVSVALEVKHIDDPVQAAKRDALVEGLRK
jgi:hypothetical protein